MIKTNKQKLYSCSLRRYCNKSCLDCKKCKDWVHDKSVKIKSIIGEISCQCPISKEDENKLILKDKSELTKDEINGAIELGDF